MSIECSKTVHTISSSSWLCIGKMSAAIANRIKSRVGSGWKISSPRAFGLMKMPGPRANGPSGQPDFSGWNSGQPEIAARKIGLQFRAKKSGWKSRASSKIFAEWVQVPSQILASRFRVLNGPDSSLKCAENRRRESELLKTPRFCRNSLARGPKYKGVRVGPRILPGPRADGPSGWPEKLGFSGFSGFGLSPTQP